MSSTHPISEHTINANGLEIAYLGCATKELSRPLAVCLHGFPDSAWTWRHLMPELAAIGYRVAAPFLRGYHPTAVPTDGIYQTAALSSDANALHAALGGDERAVIIGHDWGAPGAYGAINSAPERWGTIVGMSVPPGAVLAGAFFDPRQLHRSWYMFFFQHGLADMVVPLNDLAFIDYLWESWSPGFDASAELVNVKASLRDPANLQAALGYYRAAIGNGPRDPGLETTQAQAGMTITAPMLYLHGQSDGCIGVDVASGDDASRVENANH
jgi:pimeloyl-ACP methyl ester carboxylesterase